MSPHSASRAPPGCTLALTSHSPRSPLGAATRCGPWRGTAPPSTGAPCPPPSRLVSATLRRAPTWHPEAAMGTGPVRGLDRSSFSVQLKEHLLKVACGPGAGGRATPLLPGLKGGPPPPTAAPHCPWPPTMEAGGGAFGHFAHPALPGVALRRPTSHWPHWPPSGGQTRLACSWLDV